MKPPAPVKGLQNEKVVKIACGAVHSMCITEDGKLFTWGNSHFRQLGHGDQFNEITPKQVKSEVIVGQGRKVVDIGGGIFHTVVLTDRNEVISWGRNDEGQCGQTRNREKIVDVGIINTSHISRDQIVSVGCGLFHTLLLTANGKVISFGSNKCGQLGNEPRETPWRALPKKVEGLLSVRISHLTCGGFHSLATTGDTTFGWGENSDHQLGIGPTRTSSFVPVLIPDLEKVSVVELAAGMGHSVAFLPGIQANKTNPIFPVLTTHVQW